MAGVEHVERAVPGLGVDACPVGVDVARVENIDGTVEVMAIGADAAVVGRGQVPAVV